MKKIALFPLLITVVSIGATEVTNESMCQSIAMGFGNAYAMTKKDITPQEFCVDIISRNVTNESICTKSELVSGCMKQIVSKNQK